ncbi:uncharacterized protein E0L32_005771 [Thyridium curvatum]|uniref:RNA helicase n=1 Tax=Thyridium curvatum TaxID=1093900 RepID=A0A507B269_9PEZI|nr:uncharacterized protein E0L32_005771 [Thyridium curvatum]TPX13827.1 hypothetical protein E0L32_005771 [Thyridium curvatum]
MAPQKRKAVDDFVYTISDDEGDVVEAATETAPPKKKNKKARAPDDSGVWGQNEEDDGAMASDFEFLGDAADTLVDFDGDWGFDGAKKGLTERTDVLDGIISRRRKGADTEDGDATVQDDAAEDDEQEEDDEDDEDVDLDDDDDEVLAADAFGMGAQDEDEEEEDEHMEDGEDEEDASDHESVATANEHPEDAAEANSSDEDEEDEEELARQKEFFAPEETVKPGKKGATTSFQSMNLSRPILRGVAAVGFSNPTPIQAKTVPIALMGKDVVGGAVTGSGKTAAFLIPILERLLYRPKKVPTSRVVILTPTRELAIQCHSVATKLASYTDIKFCLAVGGLSLKMQEAELRLRPDVIIATPGRFIDHMRNSASFAVETVEILVLDEADRMLEDGFADELNEILNTIPKSRQTMLFSATMTSSVDKLIRAGLNKPARVMVDSQKKTVGTLVQEFIRLRPGREDKRMGYLVHLCQKLYTERVIIFFRQKKIAHRVRIVFGLLGMNCAELHGSMNQAQRIASVEAFRDGKVNFLLATDLASRGLDIKGVDTVINYEAPQSLEIYVHRVGRTARAGRSGVAVTLAAEPDRKVVKAAVKAGKAQGAKIASRVVEAAEADKWQAKVDEMDDEIEEILVEEKQEKQMAQMEMQVKKGENLIKHEDEIKSRPKRTWFESEKDKKKAKEAGRAQLNGGKDDKLQKMRDTLKMKNDGKLSNKDRKKLDSRAERVGGGGGIVLKKTEGDRAGQGPALQHKHRKGMGAAGKAGGKGGKKGGGPKGKRR